MVGFPYTKLMCSNEQVDQAAAIILCSVERARALGIAPDRWVFPHGVTEAAAPLVSERYDLSGVDDGGPPRADALWKLTGLGPDDIAHVDLYSCFPSAVQVQAGALGFGLDRSSTVTGGMRFAGGPWNNYAMHGLATMVDVLRGRPRRARPRAARTAATSASCRSASTRPTPPDEFQVVSAQAEVDAVARARVDDAPDGQRDRRELHRDARPLGRADRRASWRA